MHGRKLINGGENMTAYKVKLGKAGIGVDLGDGSERAEYVNQDYILSQLRRPHRCINLMYTYYPNDKQWPARISEACKDMNVSFAWDYPYDDYFPYGANGEPFNQMRDIRKHGQDVMLTLTMDTKVSNDQLLKIAKDLKPFGHLRLRINHECNGNWFTHNKRNSYKEIGAFFERAAKIIKTETPNISLVFCAGINEEGKAGVPYQQEFTCAYQAADIYSCDKYLALHYGWPYDIAEPGGGQYTVDDTTNVFNAFKRTEAHLSKLFGKKRFILGEFNTDGDVTGGIMQPDSIKKFYELAAKDSEQFLDGISMYQFRDKGRLGLEIQDPNNDSVGIRQPLLDEYRKIINEEPFTPVIERISDDEASFPANLRWGSFEDSEGIEIPLKIEKLPAFFEMTFDEENALMIEFLGRWFYKAPGTSVIDMMSVFYEAIWDNNLPEVLKKAKSSAVRIFATPRNGVNFETDSATDKQLCNTSDDILYNYYDTVNNMPNIRIGYEPCGVVN